MTNRRYTSDEFGGLNSCDYIKKEFENKKIHQKNINDEYILGQIRGKQHNIIALVGNGFDVQVLKHMGSKINTSYHDFYNFLVWQKFDDSNILFYQMKNQKRDYENYPILNRNLKNWSDFESGIISVLNNGKSIDHDSLEKSLEDLQVQFSIFLNEVVTPEINDKLGKYARSNELANITLQKFLGDLNDDNMFRCRFALKTNHYDLYNWKIFNFNYTSLLDNYIYLDRDQFDPHPHEQADRNFYFYPNPRSASCVKRNNESTRWSSYVVSDIIHPHGYQNIPKSMLFGVDNVGQLPYKKDKRLNSFIKPYWAQNDLKYAHLFEDADLYIIFGMSLGITDQWWWRKIVDSLENSASELILYNYCNIASEVSKESENVKKRFIEASGWIGEETQKSLIMDKIYVVNFDNNTSRFAFSMNP